MDHSKVSQGLWPAVLAAASLVVVLVLLVLSADALPLYWTGPVLLDAALWYGGYSVLAALLVWWRPAQAAPVLAAIAVLLLLQGLGWTGSLAALLFFTASWCSGRHALHWLFPQQQTSMQSLPLLIGLLLQLALFSLLIHFPVNQQWLYLLLLLLPLLELRHAGARVALLQPLRSTLLPETSSRATLLAWLLLAGLVLAVARYSWFPSISGDDNALHLRLWAELQWQQQAAFDFQAQVWAVAPFLLDLLHAVLSLTAGADARGALNLCLLTLLLRQLWCILAQWQIQASGRWLLLALFASTPVLANLLVTLQTELLLATLAALGVRLLLQADDSWYAPRSAGLLACAALACATKLPGAVLGLLLLLPLLTQCRCLRPVAWQTAALPQRLLLGGFVLVCAWVALHSYGLAWLRTGNPLFPLYNGIFLSPYNDPWNFSDGRWLAGFSLQSYVGLFFNTSAHYESEDFVAGFQYLFLFPLGLVLLWRTLPARSFMALALPLLGFGFVMFWTTQYWRYLFPVLPLASLALAPLAAPGHTQPARYLLRGSLLACLLLNLWSLPGISYLFELAPGTLFTAAGRAAATERFMPEQQLSVELNAIAPGSRVLYQSERPFGALLHGDPWYPMWYAPQRRDLATGITSLTQLRHSLQAEAISHVIWNMGNAQVDTDADRLLKAHLADYGLPLRRADELVLYALQDQALSYSLAWQTAGRFGQERLSGPEALVLSGARALRVGGEFHCDSADSIIVLELHWDVAPVTRQLLFCHDRRASLRLPLPVPATAATVTAELFSHDGAAVDAAALTLELH